MTRPVSQWRKPTGVFAILAVCVVLFSHLFAWPLEWPPQRRHLIDLGVYWQGAREFWLSNDLYNIDYHTDNTNLPFTYPPFGALFFTPLWGLRELFGLAITETLFSLLTLIITYAIAIFLMRLCGVRDLVWNFVTFAALLISAPIFFTLNIGQINVLLMAFTLIDVALTQPSRRQGAWRFLPLGVLTGIAAAIKLTPLVFGLYFLIMWAVSKSPRGLIGMVTGFFGATGLAFVLRPATSIQYFTEVLLASDRIGDLHYARNVSIRAVLERFPDLGTFAQALWLLLVVAVIGAVACATFRVLSQGQDAQHQLLAASLVSLVALLCSPVSWYHHWVWLAPLGVALWLNKHYMLSWWCAFTLTFGSFHNFLPAKNGVEFNWPWWMHILAAHYLIYSVAVILALSVSSKKFESIPQESR